MWLDRFSNNTTPSASPLSWSRKGSPMPMRQSSHLAPAGSSAPRRPGLPQRVTSWSGLTNGDEVPSSPSFNLTTSLRAVLAPTSHVAAESESLSVLRDILQSHTAVAPDADDVPVEHDFESDELESFARGQSSSVPVAQVDDAQPKEVNASQFRDLQVSISLCDQVLASVESRLATFQADLASVATDIEILQDKSTSLTTKLQRRKQVEQILGPKLDLLLLAPTALRKLNSGPLDDSWLKALTEVESVIGLVDQDEAGASELQGIVNRELRPLLVKARDRAAERIREFVVAQVKALRTPIKNARPIQRSRLLRQKAAFAYLSELQPQLQRDIAQAYGNTMKWYYQTNFTAYRQALDKIRVVPSEKASSFASEDSKRGAGLAHQDQFVLGRRSDAITGSAHAPSVQAVADLPLVHLEVVFRAYNLALLDNASFEFAFLTEFFSKLSFHDVKRLFCDIFEPCFTLGQALSKSLTEHTLDGLGVLLCVRLNQHFAFELQRRKVPSMESYINGTNMLLWPRFQIIMDNHCDALRKATAALRGKPVGSALGLAPSSGALQSAAPHAVTQRFANFVHGILALGTDAEDDEPVQRSLSRLRYEFDAFLSKISKGIADAKKRDRFLSNNYTLIGTIINETEGKAASEMKDHYSSLQLAVNRDGPAL